MKNINNKLRSLLLITSGAFFLTACNKSLEELAPIATPVYPSGNGMAAAIAANVNDSLYNKIIVKSGMAAILNDNTKTYTMFVPDNTAMAATFGSIANANAYIAGVLTQASCAAIVSYNTVGQKLPFASIPTTFPNYPYPTQIILDPTQPFVRMNIFPVRGTPYSYVNNIPVTAVDQAVANGIIHHVGALVSPPSATLKTTIAGEATLSYFRAAIARADSGSVGTSRLDSLLNYGVTNMTVLAPNDAAFQALLTPLIASGLIAQGVPPATALTQATALVTAVDANGPTVFRNPALYTALPVATVKGIMAYHFMASNSSGAYTPDKRIFSVNFSATPTFIPTLVNASIAVHPGILSQATFTGPIATALKFTGYGTGTVPAGAPYSGAAANAVTMDKHAVNGVYHIIDKVLLPQ